MRFIFLFLLLFISLSGCKSVTYPREIENVTYSAFTWVENKKHNNDELYIAFYISIEKNGKYKAMRREKYMGPCKYFRGIVPDSIKLKIESLKNQNYNKVYYQPGSTYNWFYYCLDYKTTAKKSNIQFIPEDAPESLREVSNLLDTFILRKLSQKSISFNLDAYKKHLQKVADSAFRP